MAANFIVFLLCLRLVDGLGTGVQRRGRYDYADKNKPRFLLADPDPVVVLSCTLSRLAAFGSVLGSIHIGNVGRVVYIVAVYERQVEDF